MIGVWKSPSFQKAEKNGLTQAAHQVDPGWEAWWRGGMTEVVLGETGVRETNRSRVGRGWPLMPRRLLCERRQEEEEAAWILMSACYCIHPFANWNLKKAVLISADSHRVCNLGAYRFNAALFIRGALVSLIRWFLYSLADAHTKPGVSNLQLSSFFWCRHLHFYQESGYGDDHWDNRLFLG